MAKIPSRYRLFRRLRRPALRVHLARPRQERDQIIELLIRQMKIRHLVAVLDTRRLGAEPAFQRASRGCGISRPAVLVPHLAEFRGKSRALAIQRMTVEAGMAFPYPLAL